MADRRKILVSNDDGYDKHSLHLLVQELSSNAEVRVCAPLTNMSGASSSLTLLETITVSVNGKNSVVHGTPTDCVHLALIANNLLPWRPDLTVTGINMGANVSEDTLYSGTIAAAAESVQLGVPAIAFSLATRPNKPFPPVHFVDAARIAADLVTLFADRLVAEPTILLNINIPDLPYEQVKKPVVCPLGQRIFSRAFDNQGDEPDDTLRLTKNGEAKLANGREAADHHVVDSGHVAITPLTFDLTDRDKIAEVTRWLG